MLIITAAAAVAAVAAAAAAAVMLLMIALLSPTASAPNVGDKQIDVNNARGNAIRSTDTTAASAQRSSHRHRFESLHN